MATTFVFPTFVLDGAISPPKLPAFVVDGALANGNVRLPTYTLGNARTDFFLPTYLLSPAYLNWTPSGGITVGGYATVVGDPYRPTGGAVIAGSAPVTFRQAVAPVGGIRVSGAATIAQTIVNIYLIATEDAEPQGGIEIGGIADVDEIITFVPTGGANVGGAAVVLERIPVIPAGGVLVSGVAGQASVIVVTPAGGTIIGGSAALRFVAVIAPSGGMFVAGAATVRDLQAWFNPSGGARLGGTAIAYALPVGAVLTTENPYNDAFVGWAANLDTGAPSRYLGLAANSFAQMAGVTYIANAGGIYALDADDDAGQPIRAGIQLAETDYGSANNKRIPAVYIGIRAAGKMRLTVTTDTGERAYYSVNPEENVMGANRVKLGLGLEGRYWTMRLENVDGGGFDFESLAFSPAVLKRHGR